MNKLKITLLLFVFTSLNGVYSSDESEAVAVPNAIRNQITGSDARSTALTEALEAIERNYGLTNNASWATSDAGDGVVIGTAQVTACGNACDILTQLNPNGLQSIFNSPSFSEGGGNQIGAQDATAFIEAAQDCKNYECIRELKDSETWQDNLGCGGIFTTDRGCEGMDRLFEQYDAAKAALAANANYEVEAAELAIKDHTEGVQKLAEKLLEFSNESDPLNVATLASQLMLLRADALTNDANGLKKKIKDIIKDSIIGKYIDAQIDEKTASLREEAGNARQRCDKAAELAKASKELACSGSPADLATQCTALEGQFTALFTPATPPATPPAAPATPPAAPATPPAAPATPPADPPATPPADPE
jgi:hypothetical protein